MATDNTGMAEWQLRPEWPIQNLSISEAAKTPERRYCALHAGARAVAAGTHHDAQPDGPPRPREGGGLATRSPELLAYRESPGLAEG